MNSSNNNSSNSTSAAQWQANADRLQGERFLQLSARCHEQNWAQVHALAEQIVSHRDAAAAAAAIAAAAAADDRTNDGRDDASPDDDDEDVDAMDDD
eukprot:CAMPEP_0181112604 /NCGR_PEP_ID=MMETSP1071-20121207/19903_1 /TAXON_ID=35127 /ORGANISM="Thalassiosira sp., Strain NH16" /LENGTH=96 /DNA_ID=CAMNT_0023196587 /DNA_START=262 /DNA_END=549 /DNA_ORIENTATION=-